MFKKPNHTQTPNEFFDDIAKTLKEGELRVMLVIMRQTFGWGNKEWDRISISQLMQKTGMERMAVIRSTKSLVEKKMVTKHKSGKTGEEECWYSLVVENPSEFSNPIDDSNSSYQYPKDTPPSILKIPTKETLTKEKEIREEAQAPQPSIFQFKRVKMEKDRYDALCDDFGRSMVEYMMNRLDEYADINPKRFKQYACHSTVIRKWIREDQEKTKAVRAGKHISSNIIAVTRSVGPKTYHEVEADNRTWMMSMEKILWPYIKEGKIYISSNYMQFNRQDSQGVEAVTQENFIEACKSHLKHMGIMV